MDKCGLVGPSQAEPLAQRLTALERAVYQACISWKVDSTYIKLGHRCRDQSIIAEGYIVYLGSGENIPK